MSNIAAGASNRPYPKICGWITVLLMLVVVLVWRCHCLCCSDLLLYRGIHRYSMLYVAIQVSPLVDIDAHIA